MKELRKVKRQDNYRDFFWDYFWCQHYLYEGRRWKREALYKALEYIEKVLTVESNYKYFTQLRNCIRNKIKHLDGQKKRIKNAT